MPKPPPQDDCPPDKPGAGHYSMVRQRGDAEPPPCRDKAPSLHEAWDVLSGTNSQAPAARWIQMRLFYFVRGCVHFGHWFAKTTFRIGWWLARTVGGTVASAVAAALASAWVTHILHLIGWLKSKGH